MHVTVVQRSVTDEHADMDKFYPRKIKTPLSIDMKLGAVDYVARSANMLSLVEISLLGIARGRSASRR